MNEKAYKILEYDKIITRLSGLAASAPGKELCGALRPEKAFSGVQAMLKETDDGVKYLVRKGSPPLGGIHDIAGSLKRADIGGVLTAGELLKICDTLRACRNLKSYAGEGIPGEEGNAVTELIGQLAANRRLEDKIGLSILAEDEISDSASPALSAIRRRIRELQNSIKDRLNQLVRSSRYQKFMQEGIVTMRGDRYVVPVKQEYRNEVPGLVHDSSSSGSTLFIEPMAVVEANNNIKQQRIKEQAEIERILAELTGAVVEMLPALASNASILGRLDFIFAKAKLSADGNCVKPELNKENRIVIKRGRHPLLDKNTVVPIDFRAGGDVKTLVITGPNTGGKTVTLKTVGLFTLMVQSGLHVPAAGGTEMCVFERVFADIGDEQSIEQSLSTFSSHMTNIVRILKEADDRSLVLFDELGAGTDPTEGAALAMSILERLRSTGCVTVATTHYSELKVYAISTKGVENACCEFDVVTLKPTYRLLIGVPGKSNAFAISKRLGLPDDILERAKEFLTQEDIKFEDILMSIERNKSEAEKERIAAEKNRMEIEALKEELGRQKQRLASQRESILKEAREEARRLLLDNRREAEELLSRMRRLEREKDAADRNREAEAIRLELKSRLDRVEEVLVEPLIPREGYVKPPDGLKPGDSVLILNLNQKGTVAEPPDREGEAFIQAGIMKIKVHASNLRLLEEQAAEVSKTGLGRIGVSKVMSISREIDIRGANLDEAVELVDKYLDDAGLAGLSEVTVIHGKGTGALRSGIQKYLRTNSRVKAFRTGRYGEGEEGVTMVELK